jgi:dihydropyrimidine dehydrogenase (NAD+) subunit PreT
MTTLSRILPEDRGETQLGDRKPLYTKAEARAEAERCLYCADAPCIKACPTSIDVPTFIKKIASDNLRGSARTILDANILGYSCARVCPVEVLCVGACVYTGWHRNPIEIGRLQRFATETATREGEAPLFETKARTQRKVALIGAGPASLACAAELAREGHSAIVFEKRPLPGGLNTTGIAPYKLHADEALHEVDWVVSLGVELRLDVEVGKDVTFAELLSEHDAVFLGVGLGSDSKLGLPGENGPGVFGATAWIEALKLLPVTAGSALPSGLGRVVVIGGGNTAIDMARECAQLGAREVTMVYRRSASEMSGYAHEIEAARKEGVAVVTETAPVAFERDPNGSLVGVRVTGTAFGNPVARNERLLACDTVGVAIGQTKLSAVARELPGVELDAGGRIVADSRTGATGHKKIWSGGDCVNGGKEVVHAVAEGRNAARDMMRGWAQER